nr:hypothetical protein CFP56_19025 [Quercus suber]
MSCETSFSTKLFGLFNLSHFQKNEASPRVFGAPAANSASGNLGDPFVPFLCLKRSSSCFVGPIDVKCLNCDLGNFIDGIFT